MGAVGTSSYQSTGARSQASAWISMFSRHAQHPLCGEAWAHPSLQAVEVVLEHLVHVELGFLFHVLAVATCDDQPGREVDGRGG